MSANASLTIVGGPTRIEPGRETTLTAEIVNLGTVPDDFRLSVREIDPAWVTFRPPTVFLQPGARATAAIVITPPSGIPPTMLRPIFRLLSRRAGNVAIVEIAMPTARPSASPAYQSQSRQRDTPPPRPRPQPAQPPAASPPPVAATPATTAPTPAAETTRPIAVQPDPRSTTVVGPPASPFERRETAAPADPREARATAEAAPRRAISPLLLALGGAIVVLLILIGVVAANLLGSSNTSSTGGQANNQSPAPEPTATFPAILPTATPPTLAPAVASRTPTATFAPKRFLVANTDGEGVYLRRTTNLDDRDTAYVDGTVLTQIAPDVQANGLTWRNVRTPDGKTGYIPAQYTQEAP